MTTQMNAELKDVEDNGDPIYIKIANALKSWADGRIKIAAISCHRIACQGSHDMVFFLSPSLLASDINVSCDEALHYIEGLEHESMITRYNGNMYGYDVPQYYEWTGPMIGGCDPLPDGCERDHKPITEMAEAVDSLIDACNDLADAVANQNRLIEALTSTLSKKGYDQ